ncbi:MAG TPA: hypothetical protein VJ995_00315 [Geothermobacteraceae bacterium]|nr:hypothetical protein [Geothermobacteraceae bacterium]
MDYEGLSPQGLAKIIPFGKSQIYNYLKGDNEPGLAFFTAVKDEFPHINLAWLVAGVGEMLKDQTGRGVHQVATGNGHIQVGGGIHVGRDAHMIRETGEYKSAGMVPVEKVVQVLQDYLAPKAIEEIKKKLL